MIISKWEATLYGALTTRHYAYEFSSALSHYFLAINLKDPYLTMKKVRHREVKLDIEQRIKQELFQS